MTDHLSSTSADGSFLVQLPVTPGDEAENANNDNNFVSHDATPAFDDLVVWVSPSTLMNRMVAAGKLP